jgi:hypothetical protein
MLKKKLSHPIIRIIIIILHASIILLYKFFSFNCSSAKFLFLRKQLFKPAKLFSFHYKNGNYIRNIKWKKKLKNVDDDSYKDILYEIKMIKITKKIISSNWPEYIIKEKDFLSRLNFIKKHNTKLFIFHLLF